MEQFQIPNKTKIDALARDVLTLSQNSLIVNFRFLDRALSALELRANDKLSLATDGCSLYYSPLFVLHRYKTEQTGPARDIMHCLLHCIYRHGFIGPEIDALRWDLACDIAVENSINELCSAVLYSKRQTMQQAVIAAVGEQVGSLTAERIYKWLGDMGFSEDELIEQRQHFRADGHGVWYGAFSDNAKADLNIDVKKLWQDIAKRMQTELETMEQDKDSALVQNLRSLNRSRYSYTEFLRRFGMHGEVMELSDEEFDNNYYTYGLQLYGNIPLIEPLEYSEQRRIRDFVIAIDTSGSVSGEVVQSFIQHTHDILQQQNNFHTKINLHILQCDDQIRHDAKIRSKEDFDEYIRNLEIIGLGKTDFRPVFSYVDKLIAEKEFTDLRGLIYFTDGEGTFPAAKPGYDTAFILHRGDYAPPEVPKWAVQLTISEEDILDKRFSAY